MTAPVQEPSQDRTDQGLEYRSRQLFRRPAPAGTPGPPGAASYLQASVHSVYGLEWGVITDDGGYTGGNGSDATAGSWVPNIDLTSPWGGYVETTVNGDWIAFGMPNLGPQFSGYGVAVWYNDGPDYGKFQIEFATSSIDEFSDTGIGSATSVTTPQDETIWGAPAFNWYNAASSLQWNYIVDPYSASPAWDFVPAISPFWLGGTDGTPLTANASGLGNWTIAKAFNGGGGPDIAWWCRIRVNGKNGSSSGFRCRIAGIRVYRLSGDVNAIG